MWNISDGPLIGKLPPAASIRAELGSTLHRSSYCDGCFAWPSVPNTIGSMTSDFAHLAGEGTRRA